MMNLLLIFFLIINVQLSAQDSSDCKSIKMLTEKIEIRKNSIFKWNHFDIKISFDKSLVIDSILKYPEALKVLILNSDNIEVQRVVVKNKRVYPDPKHALTGFKSNGETEVNKINDLQLSVRIFRKLRTSSSMHKLVANYDLDKGKYELFIEYRTGGKVLKSAPLPLIVW